MKALVTLNSDGSRVIELLPENAVEKKLLHGFDQASSISAMVEDTGGPYSNRDEVKRVLITIQPIQPKEQSWQYMTSEQEAALK